MSKILKDCSTFELCLAIEANLHEFIKLWDLSPLVEVHEEEDILWFLTGVPFPSINGVLQVQLVHHNLDTKVDRIMRPFKSRNVPMLWWIGPATRPAGLGEHLKNYGLIHLQHTPGMALPLRNLSEKEFMPAGLSVQLVGDTGMLEQWLSVFTLGHSVPEFAAKTIFEITAHIGFDKPERLQNFICLMRGEPVACGTLFFGAGVAGIWNMSTFPEVRRQGIGEALTHVLLNAARKNGYKIAVLHSSTMAMNIYRRLGFKKYCSIGQYYWPAIAKSPGY